MAVKCFYDLGDALNCYLPFVLENSRKIFWYLRTDLSFQ
jgi:hypothetical protein